MARGSKPPPWADSWLPLSRAPPWWAVPAAGPVGAAPVRSPPAAAIFSYAEMLSTAVPYLGSRAEAATVLEISSSVLGPITDSGARSRVSATGVGAPFSFRTVMTASPMPAVVRVSSRS